MKIAIAQEHAPLTGVCVDAQIPEIARDFLTLAGRRWQGKPGAVNVGEVPIAVLDVEKSHGPDDIGLIFYQSVETPFPAPFPRQRNGVTTRLSFGQKMAKQEGEGHWNPSGIGRLHIGVLAVREYFPEGRNVAENRLSTAQDIINFSLRWVGGGKFDDIWNSRGEIHPTRSTYVRHIPAGISSFGVSSAAEASDYVRKVGTRRSVVAMAEGTRIEGAGYKGVLRILSKFGEVSERDAEQIPQMDYVAGMDYLLRKIVPACESFVKS